MTRQQRDAVRASYAFACGYCGVSETFSGGALTVDHFQPVSRGGADEASNLVACCHACNEFKGAYWPTSVEEYALLHPGEGKAPEHLRFLPNGEVEGITPRGAFHIERLHLNRPELVAHRQFLREVQDQEVERGQLLERLRVVAEEVRALRLHIKNS